MDQQDPEPAADPPVVADVERCDKAVADFMVSLTAGESTPQAYRNVAFAYGLLTKQMPDIRAKARAARLGG